MCVCEWIYVERVWRTNPITQGFDEKFKFSPFENAIKCKLNCSVRFNDVLDLFETSFLVSFAYATSLAHVEHNFELFFCKFNWKTSDNPFCRMFRCHTKWFGKQLMPHYMASLCTKNNTLLIANSKEEKIPILSSYEKQYKFLSLFVFCLVFICF
jgi:hypothetical protein